MESPWKDSGIIAGCRMGLGSSAHKLPASSTSAPTALPFMVGSPEGWQERQKFHIAGIGGQSLSGPVKSGRYRPCPRRTHSFLSLSANWSLVTASKSHPGQLIHTYFWCMVALRISSKRRDMCKGLAVIEAGCPIYRMRPGILVMWESMNSIRDGTSRPSDQRSFRLTPCRKGEGARS